MKKNAFLLLLTLFFCIIPTYAKSTFVRVFDMQGHKIAKGNLVATTDTSILLRSNKILHEVHLKDIGTIKTKRAIGHSMAIGAAIGSLSGLTLGIATNNVLEDDFGFDVEESETGSIIAESTLAGIATGAAIGLIIDLVQRRKTIVINGDVKEWQQKRTILDLILDDRRNK
ncbi:hypothetical protein [Chitinophaga sp. S165]|uniref:hypothetical protein n=1 Tax=Chitinophaga sp. S165 TaxID=2135462 RepID=UPI000DA007F2|nr:hypothetical protein [Chitinophaga sp. S165]PWV48323.1 hypothetical protein C7475_107231 [Chitinophaga sp. S165]